MRDKIFFKLLIVEAITGLLLIIAHAVYIYFAYTNSSIIYFVSKEIWL